MWVNTRALGTNLTTATALGTPTPYTPPHFGGSKTEETGSPASLEQRPRGGATAKTERKTLPVGGGTDRSDTEVS